MRRSWRILRRLAVTVPLLAGMALAAAAAETGAQDEACLRAQLAGAGLAQQEIDDLFSGRIADPHAFVQSRLTEVVMRAIGAACFPEDAGGPPASEDLPGGGTPPPQASSPPNGGEASLSPAQRACVTQYLDEDTLDRLLRGEVRPETVLSRERMEEIGTACFGGAAPEARPDGAADSPPGEMIACAEGIFGGARVAELLAGAEPTPDEIRQAEAAGCFPQGAGPVAPPDGEQESCARAALGEARYEELRNARGPITISPEESAKVQGCFPGGTGGGTPPGGGGLEECVTRCAEYGRGRYTPEQCQEMCSGGPSPSEPPHPFPSGKPYPTPPGDGEGCVTFCEQQGIPREQCAAGCQGQGGSDGEGFTAPPRPDPRGGWSGSGESELPPGEWPAPTFAPAPDGTQCLSSCVGSPKGDGNSYTEPECQALCSGGQVHGVAAERVPAGWIGYLLGR